MVLLKYSLCTHAIWVLAMNAFSVNPHLSEEKRIPSGQCVCSRFTKLGRCTDDC